MVTTRTDIRLQLSYRSFDCTGPVYPIKFLLLQTVMIEASLYCCDKLANFLYVQVHKSLRCLLLIGCCLSLILNRKWPNNNKYNSSLCVLLLVLLKNKVLFLQVFY